MDYQESNLYISYKYVSAPNHKKLEAMMLQIQINNKKAIRFTPPQHVEGKWVTWYLHDYKADLLPINRVNLENK